MHGILCRLVGNCFGFQHCSSLPTYLRHLNSKARFLLWIQGLLVAANVPKVPKARSPKAQVPIALESRIARRRLCMCAVLRYLSPKAQVPVPGLPVAAYVSQVPKPKAQILSALIPGLPVAAYVPKVPKPQSIGTYCFGFQDSSSLPMYLSYLIPNAQLSVALGPSFVPTDFTKTPQTTQSPRKIVET